MVSLVPYVHIVHVHTKVHVQLTSACHTNHYNSAVKELCFGQKGNEISFEESDKNEQNMHGDKNKESVPH